MSRLTLSPEFQSVLRMAREFVRNEVLPREEEIAETDSIPKDIRNSAAALGLAGFAIPEEYGGLGLTVSEEVRLNMELAYTTPAFRSLFGTNNGIAGQVLVEYGTDEQKARLLPRLASGKSIAAFALTEIGAGSDPSRLRTSAVKESSGYLINGTKRFITNAILADVLVVFARTDPAATGTKGISVFLVPADAPGVTVGAPDKKMGQEGALTSEVILDAVRVPHDALIGETEEVGFHAAMAALNRSRLTIAAVCVGQAQRIMDESVRFANIAEQGGRIIGTFQLIQGMLAESYAELAAGRELVIGAALRFDSGEDQKLGPSSAKLFCSEMLGRVADRGVQIHGGMGYMRSVPVERFYRDARLFRIYEGTSEIQKIIIARSLLKKQQRNKSGEGYL